VRLREGLPREALARGAPFAALVVAAQASVDPPALRIDLRGQRVYCGAQAVSLPPALLAWYAWLAECRLESRGEEGFVGHRDQTPERYLTLYQRMVGRDHPSLEKARAAARQGLEPAQFEQRRSKINRLLDATLSLAAAPYKIATRGKRPQTRHGITLPPGRIEFLR